MLKKCSFRKVNEKVYSIANSYKSKDSLVKSAKYVLNFINISTCE